VCVYALAPLGSNLQGIVWRDVGSTSGFTRGILPHPTNSVIALALWLPVSVKAIAICSQSSQDLLGFTDHFVSSQRVVVGYL
jgi:hypothetical protein